MTRKNIVLFLTDQWRWDTLNDPDCPARMPNLQAFRGEATNFTNAFTSVPLCTPARGSLFTGKWPHQNGTMDNVQGTSFYPHGKLHPSHRTYMERLMDEGYDVTFIGKWHLGAGTLNDRGIADTPLSDGGEQALVPPGGIEFGETRLDPFYGTITGGIPMDERRVRIGIERLESYAKSDKPFCLIVSLQGPHFPHNVPEKWVRMYDDLPDDFMPKNFIPQFTEEGKPLAQAAHYWPCQDTRALTQADWRRTAQHYWGFCSYLDDLFGQFRRRMTDLGLDDNTVLAFTADHGEMLGAHGWFDKGPFFYEEVMRIPMLMRTPGGRAGEVRGNFVSFRDLLPTLVDQAGMAGMLEDAERDRSFHVSADDHIVYGYDAYQGRQFKLRGIRNAAYKYAWSPNDTPELYALSSDQGERTNRAGDPSLESIELDLKQRLFAWMNEEQDYLRFPMHHLPIGSYADGRDLSENPENSVPPGKPY